MREVGVGFDPHGMAVTPDDRFLLVAIRGGDSVLKVNISSGEIVSSLNVGPNPANIALTPDGRLLFVNLWGTVETLVFEAETGVLLKKIDMPELPHEIVFKVS